MRQKLLNLLRIMGKKHSPQVRRRAFAIWQKLGYLPWKKPEKETGPARKKSGGDFYRGAFDNIPFLNKDAKRTFHHLLLRPGYMIRDYIRGDHERYLAPLTALIVFFAFFALISSVLEPVQQRSRFDSDFNVEYESEEDSLAYGGYLIRFLGIVNTGITYLNLDKHPELVDTQHEAAIAALEGTLRSQGIPLFLGWFLLLWFAMTRALRRFKLGVSAYAAASAYILCQFSFFMMFAVLLTWGRSTSISVLLMFALLVIDYRQWLDIPWGKSVKRALSTGLWFALLLGVIALVISGVVALLVFKK